MVKARFAHFEDNKPKLSRIMRFKNKQEVYAYAHQYDPCCICFIAPLHKRIKAFLVNLKHGLKFHYPICCILQYCLDGLSAVPSGIMRYSERTKYVECSYHIKRNGGIQPFPY